MKSNREIRAEAKAMREQAASDKAAEEQKRKLAKT